MRTGRLESKEFTAKQANSAPKREKPENAEILSAQPPDFSKSEKQWSDFRRVTELLILSSPAIMPTPAGLRLTALYENTSFEGHPKKAGIQKAQKHETRFQSSRRNNTDFDLPTRKCHYLRSWNSDLNNSRGRQKYVIPEKTY